MQRLQAERLGNSKSDFIGLPDFSSRRRGLEEDDDFSSSAPRKKVRQACVTCHSRKVRCDLTIKGAPCSNCRDDGVADHCKLHVRKTRRASKAKSTSTESSIPLSRQSNTIGYIEPQGSPSTTLSGPESGPIPHDSRQGFHMMNHSGVNNLENNLASNMCPPFQDTNPFSNRMMTQPIPFLEADFSDFAGLDTIFDVNDDIDIDGQTLLDFDPSVAAPGQLPITVESPPMSWTTSSGNPHASLSFHEDDVIKTDADFVRNQGCFILPKSPILCKLMMVYFRFAHPNLPIINEADFWKLWPAGSDENFQLGSFSILVLQAMCFVASNYASEDLLRLCGYSNGSAARASFFRHTKLLFDFGCETNPVSLSQGALMLSYHTPVADLLRRNTLWLAQAVFFARVARADRYRSTFNVSRGSKNTSVLKRLWWGCILRDRIQPLGLRRPIIITSIEPELGLLTEQDFEDEIGQSRVHEPSTQNQIFRVIALTCKLARRLTPAMDAMFSIESSDDRSRTTPQTLPPQLAHIQHLKMQLHEWYEEASSVFPSPINLGDTSDSTTVAANMMFIYYNTAILCLCHHQMLLWETRHPPSAPHIQFETPIDEIVAAVDKMTERVRELVQLNLVQNTPISLSAYLCFPILLQAISAKAATGTHTEGAARRQLEIYLKAMRHQQIIHPASNFTSSLVDKIIFYAIDDQVLTTATNSSSSASSIQTSVIEDSRDVERGPPIPTSLRSSTQRRRSPPDGNAGSGDFGYRTIKGWRELLETKPRFYLRLALHVDWSLLTGRPPEEDHFPAQLRRSRPAQQQSQQQDQQQQEESQQQGEQQHQ